MAKRKLSTEKYLENTLKTNLLLLIFVEGHLLQVGAGYLTDPHFVQIYRANPYKYNQPETYPRDDPVYGYTMDSPVIK